MKAAGVKAARIKAAGVKAAGVKAAGMKAAGVKTAGVKAAGVKAAGVKAAGVNRVRRMVRMLASSLEAIILKCPNSCNGPRAIFVIVCVPPFLWVEQKFPYVVLYDRGNKPP